MRIDRTLADAYLSGVPMGAYRDAWFFTASSVAGQVGNNIFTPPPCGPEITQKARTAGCMSFSIYAAGQNISGKRISRRL